MKALYVLGMVMVAYFAIANCAPLFDNASFFDDEIEKLINTFKIDCSKKFDCPAGSQSCSRNTTTSEDRKTVRTEVKCFDSNGQLLNSGNEVTSEPNTNPNGIHNSYEYYGSHTGGSNTVHTSNYGGGNNPTNTNLENFQ